MTTVELLAPAGDFETALAAFAAGADAVYCGLADFSARAFAKNFSPENLAELVRYARAHDRRVYVTFNTLLDEDQLEDAVETLARLEEIGPDALIVQDLGVARLCRRHFPKLPLHASTQLVAHNLEGVLALRDLGFERVVLARELSLEEIASIVRRCGDVEIECFIHGALCYSISGLCLFSAMEKGRSGNRGKCAYCCRLPYEDTAGRRTLPFSMRDLRLGADVAKLVDVGVKSLKIEGRMKSPLYVASVTQYYRNLLDAQANGSRQPAKVRVTTADLETVFSRRTTELYLNARPDVAESPIDPESLGHLGTPVGTVKKVTKDREGLCWLRFHTSRALEKHDGLQFEAMVNGKHVGMGIVEMRQAISRQPVFEVAAGTDVEVLVPSGEDDIAPLLKPGMRIFCSMSNAVKRMFHVPSFRPSDYAGTLGLDIAVTLSPDSVSARVVWEGQAVEVAVGGTFDAAKSPDKTFAAVEKAFAKFGGTDYRLGKLAVNDPQRLFVPMSVLNDVRRDLVERLDDARAAARRRKIDAAMAELANAPIGESAAQVRRTVKVALGQKVPSGSWDEVVVLLDASAEVAALPAVEPAQLRLALPVYTPEPAFNRLRAMVKRFLRAGYVRWEASDLATLRMLTALGVADITADWSLYAFNSAALAALVALGVRRFVASPENSRENLQYLAESGHAVDFLVQQSTPLFISLTEPADQSALSVFQRNGLWITTKSVPRTFAAPEGASTRIDLSWDPQ